MCTFFSFSKIINYDPPRLRRGGFFSRTTQQPSLIHRRESHQSVRLNNQIFSTGTSHSPAVNRLYKRKSKELLPSHHNLLVCSYITTFATEKAKTAKDILNRKVPATCTPIAAPPALRFLQAKKRKQVPATGLTYLLLVHLQLLHSCYDFYEQKNKN